MTIKTKQRHSRFGIASLVIGLFNLSIIVFYTYQFAMWAMSNQNMVMRPGGLDGMQIPEHIIAKINFLIIMTLIGILSGAVSLTEKKKSKITAIIGASLNGLIFLFTFTKMY